MSYIGPQLWSDHFPLYLMINIPDKTKYAATWRFNDGIFQDPQIKEAIRKEIKEFQENHITDPTSPPTKWETLKCVIRGELIKWGARLKKSKTETIEKLLKEVHELELLHKKGGDQKKLQEVITKRTELYTYLDYSYTKFRRSCQYKMYKEGDKPGKLLARSIKGKYTKTYISKIKDNKGKVEYETGKIAEIFQKYYTELYNLPKEENRETNNNIECYMQRTALPMLSEESLKVLMEPFNAEEIGKVISTLPAKKSPGPDGFSDIFYKELQDLLSPILEETFNSVSKECPFPKQTQEAYITVIPKENKDNTLCSSYRPISLLNIDLKIYAKILAERLKRGMSQIIHLDQVGFMPSREAKDNTIKTLTLMRYAREKRIPLCLLAVDAEKAFDRLGWDSLTASLKQIGMTNLLIDKIMALYHSPSARVKVNGTLSSPIEIKNGTRQGCPLSPYLYILVMEHLAVALRNNTGIGGIDLGDRQIKLGLYADDLLLYITKPRQTFPAMMQEFMQFAQVSNFKININKTEVLNVSISKTERLELQQKFQFKWSSKAIKYLGVYMAVDEEDLYNLNYKPMLLYIKKKLRSWSNMKHSWFGRIALYKMDILPRLIYLFQTIPIKMPRIFFKILRSSLIRYVWGGMSSRLSYNILIKQKQEGGLGLPHIELYQRATLIAQLIERIGNEENKQWVQIESQICPMQLKSIPWLKPQLRPKEIDLPMCLIPALGVWDGLIKKYAITSYYGPMTPVIGNPEFLPGYESSRWLIWDRIKISPISWALVGKNLRPAQELLRGYTGGGSGWFHYFQLRDFVEKIKSKGHLSEKLSPIEKICNQDKVPKKLLSILYGLLLMYMTPGVPYYVAEWERELQCKIPCKDLKKSFVMTHKLTIATKQQETNFKILSRWYRYPTRLHVIFPQVSSICWRCQQEQGTMLHIWWDCHKIKAFWREILDLYEQITRKKIERTPQLTLLSIVPGGIRAAKYDLLRFFLGAARTVIPRHWKTTESPTIIEWLEEMCQLQRMEAMGARSQNKYDRFLATWERWLNYVNGSGSEDLKGIAEVRGD